MSKPRLKVLNKSQFLIILRQPAVMFYSNFLHMTGTKTATKNGVYNNTDLNYEMASHLNRVSGNYYLKSHNRTQNKHHNPKNPWLPLLFLRMKLASSKCFEPCKQQLEAFFATRDYYCENGQSTRTPYQSNTQCAFFKLHNLETLDFSTWPTIEEESWLSQNVLNHVFVYAIWLNKPLI